MPAKDPADRALIAQIASATRWGRTPDRAAATSAARQGLRAKFEHEADPDGILPAAERARMADHLMRAHMLSMSRAARVARAKARELGAVADAADAALREIGGPTEVDALAAPILTVGSAS